MKCTNYSRKNQLLLTLAIIGGFFACASFANAAFEPYITINNDAQSTSNRRVSLQLEGPRRTDRVRLAHSRQDLEDAEWMRFRDEWSSWWLPDESGTIYVYAQFQTRDDEISDVYRDAIDLSLPAGQAGLEINNGDAVTDNRRLIIKVAAPSDAVRMKITDGVYLGDVDWQGLDDEFLFWIPDRLGEHTISLQFQDAEGGQGNIYREHITLVNEIVVSNNQNNATDAATPAGVYPVTINAGASETKTQQVILGFPTTDGVNRIRISNSASLDGARWQALRPVVAWTLTAGAGTKSVYVEFETTNGATSISKADIRYSPTFAAVASDQVYQGGNPPGTLLKGSSPTVYYLGAQGSLHAFVSPKLFYSWFLDFSVLKRVSDEELSQYRVGTPMCVRPGTHLVSFRGNPQVYAVLPACELLPIRSEVEAYLLYGEDWTKRIITLDGSLERFYDVQPLTDLPGAIDHDKDGVDQDIELVYGSSDQKTDTDGDKLSDYEEIFYWFTDPTRTDTDNNGVSDGDAVLAGLSPFDGQAIGDLTEGTYEPPRGTLIAWRPTSLLPIRYYLRSYDGLYYYVDKFSTDERFTSNQFQKRFSSQFVHDIPFSKWVGSIDVADPLLRYPVTKDRNGRYIQL